MGSAVDTKLSAFWNMCFSKPHHFWNRGAAPVYDAQPQRIKRLIVLLFLKAPWIVLKIFPLARMFPQAVIYRVLLNSYFDIVFKAFGAIPPNGRVLIKKVAFPKTVLTKGGRLFWRKEKNLLKYFWTNIFANFSYINNKRKTMKQ